MSQPLPQGPAARVASIADSVERFVAGFNDNDLDRIMEFFAEDAVYRPGDGKEYRGRSAIRAAFTPQFTGAFGRMTFVVDDRVVDERARKATIRWVCHHDFSGAHGRAMPLLQRWLYRLMFGPRCGWLGTDIFHFDDQGKITGKFSYANYKRPQVRRDLAGPV